MLESGLWKYAVAFLYGVETMRKRIVLTGEGRNRGGKEGSIEEVFSLGKNEYLYIIAPLCV